MNFRWKQGFLLVFYLIILSFSMSGIILDGFTIDNKDITQGSISITSNTGDNLAPNIFKGNGEDLWILWSNSSGSNGEIWVARMESTSQVIQEVIQISDNPLDDWQPTGVSTTSGILWIFWESNRNGNYDIWYKNSSDNGASWSQAYFLTSTPENENNPQVVIDETNTIWVFYDVINVGNRDIRYQQLTEESSTWTNSQIVPISQVTVHEEVKSCSCTENGLILLFVQEVHSMYMTTFWSYNLSNHEWHRNEITEPDNSGWGGITSYENSPIVVYEQNNGIFYQSSNDFGTNWDVREKITPDEGNYLQPSIINQDHKFLLVWANDDEGSYQISFNVITININPPVSILEQNQELLLGAALSVAAGFLIYGLIFYNRSSDLDNDITNYTNILEILTKLATSLSCTFKLVEVEPPEIFDNRIRGMIIQQLEFWEFMHFRELKRTIPVKVGTAQLIWHLQILERGRMIRREKFGQYVIFHLTKHGKTPNPIYVKAYLRLLSQIAYAVIQVLKEFEYLTQKEIAIYTKMNRKSIQYHCKNLIDINLLYRDQDGKLRIAKGCEELVTKVLIRRNRRQELIGNSS